MLEFFLQSKMYFASGFRAFIRIQGTFKAAAFAYYGLFSLFPLLALIISLSSFLVDREVINQTLSSVVNSFFPLSSSLELTIDRAVEALISNRDRTGFAATILLIWGSSRFLNTLLSSINLAWGTYDFNWWLRSLKNLLILVIVNLLFIVSLAIPTIIKSAERFSRYFDLPFVSYAEASHLFWEFVPFIIMMIGIGLLFYITPQNRNVKIKHIWKEVLFVSISLKIIQDTFSYFISHFSSISAIYGTLGEIVGLLLWIHIVGILIIFGACLSASNYYSHPPKHYL